MDSLESIRRQYATAAMTVLMTKIENVLDIEVHDNYIAQRAFEIADAMRRAEIEPESNRRSR